MMAVLMAQVENKREAVLGLPLVEAHNRVNNNKVNNRVRNRVNSRVNNTTVHNKAIELPHLLLPPKVPTNPTNGRLLRHWTMGLRERSPL